MRFGAVEVFHMLGDQNAASRGQSVGNVNGTLTNSESLIEFDIQKVEQFAVLHRGAEVIGYPAVVVMKGGQVEVAPPEVWKAPFQRCHKSSGQLGVGGLKGDAILADDQIKGPSIADWSTEA